MKNRSFQTAADTKNRRKLDAALRQFTDDQLTAEQRLMISAALNPRSQYRLLVFWTAQAFRQALKRHGGSGIRILFGCLEAQVGTPSAALVCRGKPGRIINAVYIYLPTEMEEKQDGSQQQKSNRA